MNKTDEFSFILRPSTIPEGGVGIFALHPISKDTMLDIWPREQVRLLHESEIPEALIGLCVAKENDMWSCPPQFNKMEIGWHLNHSTEANVVKREEKFYATKDIAEGDELFIDYETLGEPEDKKEDFYKVK